MNQPTLIYVGDPMCSWCYGFGPQLTRVLNALGEGVGFRLIAGGLRPYTTKVMDDELKEYLRHHWQTVAATSGLSFDYGLLARSNFVYDTEPACRAVVTARAMRLGAALPVFLAIQDAFYREGRSPTETGTLAAVAEMAGLAREEFTARFASDAMKQATREDFAAAKQLGVRGFPTLLLQWDNRIGLLCEGYAEAEPLIEAVEEVLGVTG